MTGSRVCHAPLSGIRQQFLIDIALFYPQLEDIPVCANGSLVLLGLVIPQPDSLRLNFHAHVRGVEPRVLLGRQDNVDDITPTDADVIVDDVVKTPSVPF